MKPKYRLIGNLEILCNQLSVIATDNLMWTGANTFYMC
jgi:hypothetical protein